MNPKEAFKQRRFYLYQLGILFLATGCACSGLSNEPGSANIDYQPDPEAQQTLPPEALEDPRITCFTVYKGQNAYTGLSERNALNPKYFDYWGKPMKKNQYTGEWNTIRYGWRNTWYGLRMIPKGSTVCIRRMN
ncbi:MAG: hypothetical protein UX91_C0005G0091 [Candidatus Amesbacteria bacterium GW2011_GWB1_47_19]|nr:MAG: hypothetical protein UW51_C0007G0091 [Candidatus Amesbacteria bacterium GW2011_GWA1_44_24]KKU31173.1 MAG: hypothetical protein UX46_C0007G0091 [Candidatus Amesbacteria bacterium GW2011_GWC1_46_24]KKU67294.1 MAG: hypothetical protein UX91_C0005G0091 [Candidatus Amesbacteria bacterium GW2011_GWB1_47_19]OGD05850.1 MAG: hypothetical protein A2379_01935 [Candidatus Amesbacteria bacterium RIFOXYB1_FULL_47_13]HBC72715.1 hypothetical protein [Candidatus Amesbacteria bacterium]